MSPYGNRPRQSNLLGLRVLSIAALTTLMASTLAWAGNAVANDSGEGPYFTFVQQAGGSASLAEQNAEINMNSVSIGSNGQRIVTGRFTQSAYFPKSATADDSIALTSAGDRDIFVASLNPDTGYFTWAIRAGGDSFDTGESVTVSSDDTLLITGMFRSPVAYFPKSATADDSIALTSAGDNDIFVAGLNPDTGFFSWAIRAGGTNTDNGRSIALTGDDTAVITGDFRGTAYFPRSATADDSIALTSSAGSFDIFVAGLNPDTGYFAWAIHAGDTSNDSGQSVAITGDDSAVITGYIVGTVYFPRSATADDSIALTAAGPGDIFVAGLNPHTGYFTWAVQAGGTSGNDARSVAVTSDGSSVVTGLIQGTTYFPRSATADDSIALTSAGGFDIFVAGVNPDTGYFTFAVRAGGTNLDNGQSVAVTSDGAAVITGRMQGTAYFPMSATADDSIALTSAGNDDIFAAGVNPDTGYFTWAIQAGSTSFDYGQSAAVTSDDTPVISGTFKSTAYFPSSVDDSIAVSTPFSTQSHGFIAALEPFSTGPGPDPGPTPTPPGPVVFGPSAPLNVAGMAGDTSVVVSWSPPVSAGSFPITTYQARVSPGGQSCLATAPALTCTITGLTNNTTYTATARALNGAGWGPYSAASAEFTPRAPLTRSITITGTRGDVRGQPGIIVTGTTTGFAEGAILRPWFRFPGQTSYSEGSARIPVSDERTFTWQRRTGKKIYVTVRSADGAVVSNRITISR